MFSYYSEEPTTAYCVGKGNNPWYLPKDCIADKVELQGNYETFEYVGCFKQSSLTNPDLKYGPLEFGFTPTHCAIACRGYNYFALSEQGFCSCDYTHGTPASEYPALENDGLCQNVCKVANWVKLPCGGRQANAVYRFTHNICKDATLSVGSETKKWHDNEQRSCEWFLLQNTCGKNIVFFLSQVTYKTYM